MRFNFTEIHFKKSVLRRAKLLIPQKIIVKVSFESEETETRES